MLVVVGDVLHPGGEEFCWREPHGDLATQFPVLRQERYFLASDTGDAPLRDWGTPGIPPGISQKVLL